MKGYMDIEEAIGNLKVEKSIETAWDPKMVSWFD
jgi:hypothetical protein